MRKFLLLLIAFSIFVQCKSTQNKSESKVILTDILREPFNCKSNGSNTFRVCYEVESSKDIKPPKAVKLVILDNESTEILFEDRLVLGKVNWLSDTQVRISENAEIVNFNNDNSSFIYDLNLRKKVSNNYEKE